MDLRARSENQVSGPGRRELVGVFAQYEVDISFTQLGRHIIAEPIRVRVVQKLLVALNDGDLLVLHCRVSIASPSTSIYVSALTGYSSRSSPASSTELGDMRQWLKQRKMLDIPMPTEPPPTMTTSSADFNRCCHWDTNWRMSASLSGKSMGPVHLDPVANTRTAENQFNMGTAAVKVDVQR